MNRSTAENAVQWLFLDLNAFFASSEQQGNPALRGKPVIVVATPAFLLARPEELWHRVPRYKPLSVGVVLLHLVPTGQHQPDLFAADTDRRQKLSPLIDRINDRYGSCAIGFGLLPLEVRALRGHAAFQRVRESREF